MELTEQMPASTETRLRRVAFITDASEASGLAIATHLMQAGAAVVLNVPPPQAMDAVRGQIGPFSDEDIQWTASPLTTRAEVDRVWSSVLARWGRIDILVHNSNVVQPMTIADGDISTYRRLMDINVKSAFLLAQSYGSQRVIEGGRLIFVSSIHDEKPTGVSFAYSAAKGALLMLAREAALDLGRRGVAVTVVEVGPVAGDDRRFASELSDVYRDFQRKIPSTQLGTPDDIAHLVGFLALPASAFLNGANIRLDGGFSLHYMDHQMRQE
jgi:glucose 1-dehydrogenase